MTTWIEHFINTSVHVLLTVLTRLVISLLVQNTHIPGEWDGLT